MRRSRSNHGIESQRRAGVTARVIARNASVHQPVARVMYSIGFAPRLSVAKRQTSRTVGSRQAANTVALMKSTWRGVG